ncbi:hypothetical protein THAOC_27322 [Thalassiosira oceanica]|uniref:Uncharacterized protein n=1 Tax=Thalassiosira oceanica TaxID=159749 RepID=K0RWR2_THAOC|nr:hypothetical protein THAOC_27322 [Thalassiosira oceanica]|eukprot:EJK53271.1 hypothetical protein THAOC_27322 [Thalassiosira oceanica]
MKPYPPGKAHYAAYAPAEATYDSAALILKIFRAGTRDVGFVDSDPNLQDQLSLALALQMEETFKLGYCGEKQMKQLKKNAGHLNNSLCFFKKHWKSLLTRFQSKVDHHLNTLQRLQWDHFARSNKELRNSIAGVMSEFEKFLVKVLSLKKDELKKDANSKKRSCPFEDAPTTTKPKVSSAFKKKNAVLSPTAGSSFR